MQKSNTRQLYLINLKKVDKNKILHHQKGGREALKN